MLSAERNKPCRIVLAEDHDDSREMLSVHLNMLGYEVHTAADGEEALKLVELVHPSAVIADLHMPRMDGFRLARLVREKHGRDVRLIALTGLSPRKAWTESMEAGFDFYLMKPVDGSALGPYLEGPLYPLD